MEFILSMDSSRRQGYGGQAWNPGFALRGYHPSPRWLWMTGGGQASSQPSLLQSYGGQAGWQTSDQIGLAMAMSIVLIIELVLK